MCQQLNTNKAESATVGAQPSRQLFTPNEMMNQAEKFALSKSQKSNGTILGLSTMAGTFIGLAFIFYITVTTGSEATSWGLNRFIGGLAFSMGLILIVLCGGELFTSSVLSCISWANKQISLRTMLGIWGKVYIGNFLGAMLLLLLVTAAGLYQLDGGQWGLNALNIAQHKLHHTPLQAFSLGILCNLLVCLAIWLTFSSDNAMTKALLTMLPVAMFISSGFEHCVANMFMVPLGIILTNFAPESFWIQIGSSPSQFSDLTISHFLTANLIPVTLGNIVGGTVLVGLTNWVIYRRPQLRSVAVAQLETKTNPYSAITNNVNISSLVEDVMDPTPITLRADTPVPIALDALLENKLTIAPVCDANDHLIGFFSTHDVMVDLWCEDYKIGIQQKVVDLMSHEVLSVQAKDRLLNVAERFCIDKEQLFPANEAGVATQLNTMSVEERAKTMKASVPHTLAVLEGNTFVGIIDRHAVMKALRPIYGKPIIVTKPHNQRSA
ncbi:formate transporter FocA [Vibrio amylolyticus]|uniref:formate transporter FocA n=1 Tax=Vibrio amylolyticus TaxID=2847292 RepID=UPI003553D9A9